MSSLPLFRFSLRLRATKNQIHTLSWSSRTDDARYLIWKSCSEKSEAWQVEQKRIWEEANKKRSEATIQRPREEAGTFKTSGSTSSAPTGPVQKAKESQTTRTAKAITSHTDRGTVERMELLWTRPRLSNGCQRQHMRWQMKYLWVVFQVLLHDLTNRDAIRDVPGTNPP